jgi:cytochrome b subunit of formate dehydrogenase
MMTWKQIFGPNFSVEQIELLLMIGAFGAILAGIFVLLYLYNQLADDL